jgi:hypothetical protein
VKSEKRCNPKISAGTKFLLARFSENSIIKKINNKALVTTQVLVEGQSKWYFFTLPKRGREIFSAPKCEENNNKIVQYIA